MGHDYLAQKTGLRSEGMRIARPRTRMEKACRETCWRPANSKPGLLRTGERPGTVSSTLYVSPKDSVLPVEDRAIDFPSVCFCVVFIKIQNTAFWQHCIWGECSFSKLTKPLHNRSKDNKVSWLFCRIAPAVENITCALSFPKGVLKSILFYIV